MTRTRISLAAEASPQLVHLAGRALPAPGEDAPDWIQITPAGRDWKAKDGRFWRCSDPARVVATFRAGLPLPVDINHSTEIRAKAGDDAPAVGWIAEMDVREGAIWARVEWNEAGREAVISRAYRFVSPCFVSEKATAEVRAFRSLALVTHPALTDIPALASQQTETAMEPQIAEALSLAQDATAEDALAAIARLRDAPPDIARFAPRAELETALARAESAETQLAERDRAARAAEIDALVDGAIEAGKVPPSTREFYVAACADAGQRAAFAEMVKGAAPIVGAAQERGDPPTGGAVALAAEEREACAALGMSVAEFIEAKSGEAA